MTLGRPVVRPSFPWVGAPSVVADGGDGPGGRVESAGVACASWLSAAALAEALEGTVWSAAPDGFEIRAVI